MQMNGKEIQLNGKGSTRLMSTKIAFAMNYTDVQYDEVKKTLSFVEPSLTAKGKDNSVKRDYDRIESATEYDNAVYFYGYNVYNGQKTRIVFDKA